MTIPEAFKFGLRIGADVAGGPEPVVVYVTVTDDTIRVVDPPRLTVAHA